MTRANSSNNPKATKAPNSKGTSEPKIAATAAEKAADARAKEPFYEIVRHKDNKFYWCLWSGNGRAMAESSIGYDSKKHCIQAIRLIAPNSNAAKLVTQSHPDDSEEPAQEDAEDQADEGEVDEEEAAE